MRNAASISKEEKRTEKGKKRLIKETKYGNFPFLVGSTASKEVKRDG